MPPRGLLADGATYEMVPSFHFLFFEHCSTMLAQMEVADCGCEVDEQKEPVECGSGHVAIEDTLQRQRQAESGQRCVEQVNARMTKQIHDEHI